MKHTDNETDSPHDVQYLRLSGRLYPDNRLELRPSYLSSNPRDARSMEDSPVQVSLYDGDEVLLRWGAIVAPVHEDTFDERAEDPAYRAVRAKVPFPTRTTRIEIHRDDIELAGIDVPRDGPEFVDEPTVKRADTGWRVDWETDHPTDEPTFYHVRTSADGGETWRRVAWRLDEPGVTLPDDSLVGGEQCTVEVVAYDGVNTVSAATTVPEADAMSLTVEIVSPGDESSVAPPVSLRAIARLHGHPMLAVDAPAYEWTANKEVIGEGPDILWFAPDPGRYTIRVDANYEGFHARDTLRLRVDDGSDAGAE